MKEGVNLQPELRIGEGSNSRLHRRREKKNKKVKKVGLIKEWKKSGNHVDSITSYIDATTTSIHYHIYHTNINSHTYRGTVYIFVMYVPFRKSCCVEKLLRGLMISQTEAFVIFRITCSPCKMLQFQKNKILHMHQKEDLYLRHTLNVAIANSTFLEPFITQAVILVEH